MAPLLPQRLRPEPSFERIYRRHVGDVYRYALAVLRNPADAEDVTQTTFLNAYRAYERGERPRAAQNWLIAIAHNVCRQRFRQAQRRVAEVTFDENVAESLEPEDVPTAEEIRRALGQLAFNQRAALVMRELEGRSYGEIAEILGLSVSAVETLIFRARRALREQLEGSLSCREAELAISKQLDGELGRAERGPLRAHLRECAECASLARKQRAQRAAIKGLAAVPVPASLVSLFGGGGAAGAAAASTAGVAAKAAAVAAASLTVAGVGYQAVKHVPLARDDGGRPAAAASSSAAPAAASAVAGEVNAATERPRSARPTLARPAGSKPVRRAGAPRAAARGSEARGTAARGSAANGRGKAERPLRAKKPSARERARARERAAPVRERARARERVIPAQQARARRPARPRVVRPAPGSAALVRRAPAPRAQPVTPRFRPEPPRRTTTLRQLRRTETVRGRG